MRKSIILLIRMTLLTTGLVVGRWEFSSPGRWDGWVGVGTVWAAAIPEMVTYQGRLVVDGVPFTGQATFRFGIVTSTGGVLWANDGGSFLPPAAGVTREVSTGVFTVVLGSPAVLGEAMVPVPAGVFREPRTFLRVWVSAPTTAPVEELVAELVPVPHAHQVTSVPYSQRAEEASSATFAVSAGSATFAQRAAEFTGEIPVKLERVEITSTTVQTLVVTTSATFTGPVIVKEGLAIGGDTIYEGVVGGNGIANAITYTAVPAASPAQIRTSATGPANTSNPNPTGAVPLTINAGAGGILNLNNASTGHLLLGVGGGNVGIGTSTPAARLDVQGDIVSTGTVSAGRFVGDGSGLTNVPVPADVARTTQANTFTSSQTVRGDILSTGTVTTAGVVVDGMTLVVDSVTHRVGIGTAAPTARLDVQQADDTAGTTALRVQTGATPTTKFSVDGAGNATLAGRLTVQGTTAGPSGEQGLQVNDNAAFLGRVGIGIPGAPTARLDIQDSLSGVPPVRIRGTGGDLFLMDSGGSLTTFGGLSANNVTVRGSGRVGIGIWPPTEKLDVVGTIAAGLGTVKMRMGEIPGVSGDFQIRTNAKLTEGVYDPRQPSWAVRTGHSSDDFAVFRLSPGGVSFDNFFRIGNFGNVTMGSSFDPFLVTSRRFRGDAGPSVNTIKLFGEVDISGLLRVNGNPVGDLSEYFLVQGATSTYEPGDVLVVAGEDGSLAVSTKPDDPAVVGVYSGSPALMIGQQGAGLPVAVAGRVAVKAVGPIKISELLVTSSVRGRVKANSQPLSGTIVGKALGSLPAGVEGTVVMLVTGR